MCPLFAQPEPKTSPDGRMAIAKGDKAGQFFFVDLKSGHKLGHAIPDHLWKLKDVEIETCHWSTDSSKVALVFSYGTKLMATAIYAIASDGTFHDIDLPTFRPREEVQRRTGKKFSEEAPGYDEDATGGWSRDGRIQVLYGEAKEYERGTEHFFVVVVLHVLGSQAKVEKVAAVGPMPDDQGLRFYEKWSRKIPDAKE
jgi:hypothetical protein